MLEQITSKQVVDANLVITVVDGAEGDTTSVMQRAFLEWVPKIRDNNKKSAKILVVINKFDLISNKKDVIDRCSQTLNGLCGDDESISVLFISSKEDYCLTPDNQKMSGSVKGILLAKIREMLDPTKLFIQAQKLRAICPHCNKERLPGELKQGSYGRGVLVCEKCREHVCQAKECKNICHESEGDFCWGTHEKRIGVPYCCETCKQKDEPGCSIM